MNEFQDALNRLYGGALSYVFNSHMNKDRAKRDYAMDKNKIQELVDRATILQDENVQKLLKTFIPIDEPYCSNCMFYTESDCDKKDNCYLSKFIKAIDWSKDE